MSGYFEYEPLAVPASKTLKEKGLDITPKLNQYNIGIEELLDNSFTTKGLNLDGYFSTEPVKQPINKTLIENSQDIVHTKFTGNNRQLLEKTLDKYGITGQKRTTLLKIASLESKFNQVAQSKNSSAAGWFQMIDSTRKTYTNLSREDFKNNPDAQVLAASKLYDDNAKFLKNNGIKVTGEAIATTWLNPTWAKNYYKYGHTGGSDANGTTVQKYITMYRNA